MILQDSPGLLKIYLIVKLLKQKVFCYIFPQNERDTVSHLKCILIRVVLDIGKFLNRLEEPYF